MFRQIVQNRWFALADLLLVLTCGLAWVAAPGYGIWFTAIACLPWVLRLSAGRFPFQRTAFDWLIILFVITAGVGLWAAYNTEAAAHKFWLLLVGVLLYYALSGQPSENLVWVARLFFSIGVGVSIYFFLSHDFVALPRKLPFVNAIGLWIMQVRPSLAWKPIHPNYVAGIAAIMTPFAFYPKWELGKKAEGWRIASQITKILSLAVVASALVMTTSRGVVLAIITAIGAWILWKALEQGQRKLGWKLEPVFPILVLCYLLLVVVLLYAGPASFTGPVSAQSYYGSGTRAELFTRSLYFLRDFPFTGGGLASFPGLYSYYMLEIPSFYLINSHNLFLDVALEQGVVGGWAYLLLFLGSVWLVARSIVRVSSPDRKLLSWLVLFALSISIVHGMVDDYLYNGNGALLAVALIGISIMVAPESRSPKVFGARPGYRTYGFVAVVLIGLCLLKLDSIRAEWYADLGAVEMAQAELVAFPSNEWTDPRLIPQLGFVETLLRSSLRYDPNNESANYHLGMISMLQQDFDSAAAQLGRAHQVVPNHRGIIKKLGYCYVWLGDLDKAKLLLAQIPESKSEMEVYSWWWTQHGRPDLAKRAAQIATLLDS